MGEPKKTVNFEATLRKVKRNEFLSFIIEKIKVIACH